MSFEAGGAKKESFLPDFLVSESQRSTEEKPVLHLSYGGITFEARLDLIGNSLELDHVDTETDVDPADSVRLQEYAQKVANKELNVRLEKYSQYFA
jgi:hypothetical protein